MRAYQTGVGRRLLSQLAASDVVSNDWRDLLARMRHCLGDFPGRAGPTRTIKAAFRLCDQASAAGLTVGSADFAALRRYFEAEAPADCRLANAWPAFLLDRAAALGHPAMAASLLDELERQVGLTQLAGRNPGLLARMAEERLQLEDAPGCRRCLDALAASADLAVRLLLAERARSLLRRLPDAESAAAVWPADVDTGQGGGVGGIDSAAAAAAMALSEADLVASRDRLLAYCASAGQQRRENTPRTSQRNWDLGERLVALAGDAWGPGALREALLKPACRHGLLFSGPAALLLARQLAGSSGPPTTTTVLEATADLRCPGCGGSLAEAYTADDLDTADLAERLVDLRQLSGQPVWQTDPDESADFRQWLRHKTARFGRPGAVLDLNNMLLQPHMRRASGGPNFAAFFASLDRELPLAGRPLRHLVFVGKLAASRRLYRDEFFSEFRQYCSRAPVSVSLYLFKRSPCDDLFALYASMTHSPGCYMLSADQFREQRKHLSQADRRAFQRWQAAWQVAPRPDRGGRLAWPPGFPVRSLAHADGSAHLLCAPPDGCGGGDGSEDLTFWPSFGWVCVPPTA